MRCFRAALLMFVVVTLYNACMASTGDKAIEPKKAQANEAQRPVRSGLYHWVQFERGSRLVARIIVSEKDSCPSIAIDGNMVHTTERENRHYKREYPIKICQAFFGAEAQKVSFSDGTNIMIPSHSNAIGIIGDSGCLGTKQNCNSTTEYPAISVADALSQHKELSLVVHIGDYIYNVPSKNYPVANSKYPSSDSWGTAEFEFFKPMRSLLLSKPLLMVRGNHEDCDRAGKAWFTLFDVSSEHVSKCKETLEPYYVDIGSTRFLVLDSNILEDENWPALATKYKTQVGHMKTLGKHAKSSTKENVLLTHRPMAGIVSTGYSVASTTDDVSGCGFRLGGALIRSIMNEADILSSNITMVISGHIHNGQVLSFKDSSLPIQIISGNGGGPLNKLMYEQPSDIVGCTVTVPGARYASIANAYYSNTFGFSIIDGPSAGKRTLSFYDNKGKVLTKCSMHGRQFSCD